MNNKDIKTTENVDAIYIDGKYQSESKPLKLNKNDIEFYQCGIKLSMKDKRQANLWFHSVEELLEFCKAYSLK